jgi:NitT/TauT family transport system ATP-binding protein
MNIQLKDVSKKYGNTLVFEKLNIEIKENKITCIMGPSGVGKTTLIHILMGLVKPDSGRMKGLDGKKVTAVFQEDRLCEWIDAIKNVQLVCDSKITEEQIKREFLEVGLFEYENKPVSELSGGMKRRVAVVRALMPDCEIAIMDEPFSGLDDQCKDQVIEYVKRKTIGKTVIVVTHDKEDADKLLAELIGLYV